MSDDTDGVGPRGLSDRSLHAKLTDEHGQARKEHRNRRMVPLDAEDRAVTAADAARSLSSLRGRGLDPIKVKGDREAPKGLREGGTYNLVEKPHIDALLTQGYVIIYNELERLFIKSQTDEGLSSTESKMFEGYVKSIRALATEEREQREADKADKMADDELIKAASDLLGLD